MGRHGGRFCGPGAPARPARQPLQGGPRPGAPASEDHAGPGGGARLLRGLRQPGPQAGTDRAGRWAGEGSPGPPGPRLASLPPTPGGGAAVTRRRGGAGRGRGFRYQATGRGGAGLREPLRGGGARSRWSSPFSSETRTRGAARGGPVPGARRPRAVPPALGAASEPLPSPVSVSVLRGVPRGLSSSPVPSPAGPDLEPGADTCDKNLRVELCFIWGPY